MARTPDEPRPRRRDHDGRRRVLLAGVSLAVLAFLSAGALAVRSASESDSAPLGSELAAAMGDGGATGAGAGEQAAGPGAAPTSTQVPDRLPDPAVGSGQCKMVTYTPPGAREAQQGELCRPKDNQRNVAVVIVHGGAGVAGTYAGMKPWANRLNTEGYVTFAVDYHLFTEGGAGPVFPWPEQNIKASVQFLRGTANALGIRADHIAVEGFSAGARLGAEAFTTPNDPYFLGNELWPFISDEVNAYVGFYHPLDGSMQHSYQYYGGNDDSTVPDVVKRWDLADSLSQAARATGPALYITGANDWDIQMTQGAEFIQRLKDAGHDGAIIVVPGGGHGFDQADGYHLSKLGEQSASAVLVFLNKAFPQSPSRPAQAFPADVVNAPEYTGLPPTSFVPRPQSTYRSASPSSTYRYVPPTTATTPRYSAPPPSASVVMPPPTASVPVTPPPTASVPVTPPPTTAGKTSG